MRTSKPCSRPPCAASTCPTLLVRGLLSDVVTEEGVQDFLDKIPGARLVDVGGAAHMVAGDQNDVFSHAVVAFLEDDIRPRLPQAP